MKDKKYIIKGTPIVPSLCGIGMAVLWYTYFGFGAGKWHFQMKSFSFSEMTGAEIYFTALSLLIPVVFFIGVLFLAEIDLRWMIPVLLLPIVNQISIFVARAIVNDPLFRFDYPLRAPFQFAAPFLALILFVLTVEKILPTKWIFVGFCGIAVLLPLILTLCNRGEFFDPLVSYTPLAHLWSDYLSFALYYLGLGALAIQMRPPKELELTPVTEEEPAEETAEEI